ncbi:MAG: DUF3164 family protein [Opitutales bacterium]|nr:DUF3164 family protein [Opitutales bacterium]
MKTEIPEGYMEDHKGRLVPTSSIKEIDITRDNLVKEIVSQAKKLSEAISQFRLIAHSEIQAFTELSAKEYGCELGGRKGNLTLLSFDGKYKVQRAVSDHLVFDERLQTAKQLIDECLIEWSDGASDKLKTLVNDAFQVSKEGQINTGRVLSLRRMDFDHEKWKMAMEAISDSLQVASTKTYLRIYERVGQTNSYKNLPLDIAKS